MKISDLAHLVAVRNHISTVMGDKSVCSKDDVRPLNEARMKLDKKFVAALRNADVESLFCYPVTVHIVDSAPQLIGHSDKVTVEPNVSKAYEQIPLDLSSQDGIWEDADTIPDHQDDTEEARKNLREQRNDAIAARFEAPDLKPKSIEEDPEAEELALIAERVKAQKEQLKKEGRSNKRKPKEDGVAK